MKNFKFVERLLEGTKCGEVEWKEFNSTLLKSRYDQAFSCFRNDAYIIIAVVDNADDNINIENRYFLTITDKNYTEKYIIDDMNLFDGEDTDAKTIFSKNDRLILPRLYRLAERNSKKIDELLEKIVKDLTDPNELPF